jgi:hypothetical protein
MFGTQRHMTGAKLSKINALASLMGHRAAPSHRHPYLELFSTAVSPRGTRSPVESELAAAARSSFLARTAGRAILDRRWSGERFILILAAIVEANSPP